MKRVTSAAISTLVLGLLCAAPSAPALAEEGKVQPFIVESYYRIKWGHFDEFMELFKRNHYPILARLEEMGQIQSMNAAFPVHHGGEDSRWDWRMTIVIPDRSKLDAFEKAFAEVTAELYPDAAKLKQEEQRRFSLLLEHTDVPITVDDLSGW